MREGKKRQKQGKSYVLINDSHITSISKVEDRHGNS